MTGSFIQDVIHAARMLRRTPAFAAAAIATLVADGATPTQAHVTALNSAWGTLKTALDTLSTDVGTLSTDWAALGTALSPVIANLHKYADTFGGGGQLAADLNSAAATLV